MEIHKNESIGCFFNLVAGGWGTRQYVFPQQGLLQLPDKKTVWKDADLPATKVSSVWFSVLFPDKE